MLVAAVVQVPDLDLSLQACVLQQRINPALRWIIITTIMITNPVFKWK
jgi:hypothetical protein